MKIESSYITLNDLKIYAYHGVAPQENKVGNTYHIDLKMKIDMSKAAATDRVETTVSYADVFVSIKEEMQIPSKLLEHLAYRICKRLYKDFYLIEAINLKVKKENPPMGADVDTAGVEVNCSRN